MSDRLPRMIVASKYDQVRDLQQEYPDDLIVVAGRTNVLGYEVSEIVDRTIFIPGHHVGSTWWLDAESRVRARR